MTKTYLFLGAAALTIGLALYAPTASQAYKGDPSLKGPNCSAERHSSMTEALKNKDYNAWKKLMDGRGIASRINEANFGEFAQAHELAIQGKTAEADQIRAELGLGQHNKYGRGQGFGQMHK